MIEEITMVTQTALERFHANRRVFIFKDRFGDHHTITYNADRTLPFSAMRLHAVAIENRFSTLRELRDYLSETA